ncbi:hypothetical protein NDU88_003761 [Pleurodeles waltl]|uniref:Uncharacterized protein n=1 Tax=Pleurodeles waltl TaxID=8319 RepID=A0AAV7SGZ3_PLEWA|nr:hypothetical protein NDU88_003761 [Pleurodeles waltl]
MTQPPKLLLPSVLKGSPPSSVPHQRKSSPAAAPPFPSCSVRVPRPESQARAAKATIEAPRPASNISSNAGLLRPAGLLQPRPGSPRSPVQHQPARTPVAEAGSRAQQLRSSPRTTPARPVMSTAGSRARLQVATRPEPASAAPLTRPPGPPPTQGSRSRQPTSSPRRVHQLRTVQPHQKRRLPAQSATSTNGRQIWQVALGPPSGPPGTQGRRRPVLAPGAPGRRQPRITGGPRYNVTADPAPATSRRKPPATSRRKPPAYLHRRQRLSLLLDHLSGQEGPRPRAARLLAPPGQAFHLHCQLFTAEAGEQSSAPPPAALSAAPPGQ